MVYKAYEDLEEIFRVFQQHHIYGEGHQKSLKFYNLKMCLITQVLDDLNKNIEFPGLTISFCMKIR